MKKKIMLIYNSIKRSGTFNNKKIYIVFFGIVIFIIFMMVVFTDRKVKLSCEDVEKIAVKKLGGGLTMECKRKRKIYEIEIIYKDYEYEFKINGNTGEIVSYDAEILD